MTTLIWPTVPNLATTRLTAGRGAVGLVAGVVVCALIGRLVFLAWPFDSDGAMFIYLGKSVCRGDRFFHDVVDNKFPTVGLVTSVFWRLFGTNWADYVLAQTAMAFAAAGLLARTVRRHVGRNAALATFAAAMIYLNFSPCVFGGFQLETIQLFFATISAAAAIETLSGNDGRDALLAGLAGGCAALLKPTGLAPLATLLLMLGSRRQWRTALFAAAGLLLPLGVGVIYMARTHVLGDLPAIARQIADYASQTPMRLEDALKPIIVVGFVGIGLLIRGWVFRRTRDGAWRGSLFAFAGIWFAFELIGAVAQRRMYAYHFLPIAPPAALLFGLLPRKSSPLQLAAALLPVAAGSVLGAAMLWRSSPVDASAVLDRYVRDHSGPGDAIWSDNCSRLLLDTDRPLGGRIPLTFIFGNTDSSARADAALLINDFSIRRPLLILLPADLEKRIARDQRQTLHLQRSPVRAAAYADAWRQIGAYVQQHYTPREQIGEQQVWRLNGR